MSYCRFSDGDVYLFAAVSGHMECCSCVLSDERRSWLGRDTDATVAHVLDHIAAGHSVPDTVIPRLLAEREENDAWLAGTSP